MAITTPTGIAAAAGDEVHTSPATMRHVNSRAVLRHLLESRADQTTAQLVEATGLTAPTVHGALELLKREGWITIGRSERSPGQIGRSAQFGRFRRDSGVVIGADLQRDNLRIVVADLGGGVLTTESLPLSSADDVHSIASELFDVLDRTSSDPVGPLRAVTLGVPGIVTGEEIISEAVPQWAGRALIDALSGYSGSAPVAFANDLKLAAGAELSLGELRGVENGVYLHLGTQVGAAIVVGGSVVAGHTGSAGELGVLPSSRWHDVGVAVKEGTLSPEEGSELLIPSFGALIATIDPAVVAIAGDHDYLPWARAVTQRLESLVPAHPGILRPAIRTSNVGVYCTALGAVDHALRHSYSELMQLNGSNINVTIG